MNSLRIIPDEMLQEITSAAVIPTLVRNIREMWDYIRKRSGDRMVIPFADRLNTLSRDELLKELLHYTCKPVYSAAEAALKEKMEQAILYRLGIAHADIEVRIRPTPIVTEENEAEWSNYLTKLSRPCPLCESGLMNPTSESYYTNDDNYCWVLACDKCSCSISFVEPQDNRGGADMVQFNGTQCVNYQSLESALEAHAEDIPEQFDKASGFEHFCRQLGRLVGDECTPKCPHYKYNKSLQHQYAGLLDNAFKLDIEIVFCGNSDKAPPFHYGRYLVWRSVRCP